MINKDKQKVKLGKSILVDIVSWLKERGYTINIFSDVYENKSIPFFFEWESIMEIIDKKNNKFIIDVNWESKIYDSKWEIIYNNWKEYNDWLPFDIENATNKDYLSLEDKWYSIDESSWYSIFNTIDEMNDEFICLNDESKDVVEFIDNFIKSRG